MMNEFDDEVEFEMDDENTQMSNFVDANAVAEGEFKKSRLSSIR